MRRLALPAAALALAAVAAVAGAADRIPPEFVTADEIVSLAADTPLDVALELISEVARRATGKIIVDPEGRTAEIGIDVTRRPWREALELILKVNQLWYREMADYYQVVLPPGAKGQPGSRDTATEPEIGLDTREVRIQAVFFEVESVFLREIGVDWTALKDGALSIGLGGHGGTAVSDPFGSASLAGTLSAGRYTVTLDLLLNLIEAENRGRVIARPEIVVEDRQKGRIQVGQDFSIKTRDFAGNTTDAFYSAGTILEVEPRVYREGDIDFIRLRLGVERSTANPGAVSTVINKASANSIVLLRNGESTVIGGLFNAEGRTVRKGVPGLRRLPAWLLGLRYLFGYDRDDLSSRELIIVLQAEMLPPLAERDPERGDLDLLEAHGRASQEWGRRVFDGPGVRILAVQLSR